MPSDEQQIRQLVETWMSATKAGDTETVLGLMTDDVVFLLAGQPPMIGKAAYAAAGRTPPGQPTTQFEGHSEIKEVTVVGDWAYIWTHLTVVVKPPGGAPPMTRAGNTLSILKKQDGKWLLARDANMLVPRK
jgi:uncharacterized protein (TIGR02246 family)